MLLFYFTGVVEILNREREKFLRLGVDFVVSKICVRDPSKARDFCIPTTTTIVTSVDGMLHYKFSFLTILWLFQ